MWFLTILVLILILGIIILVHEFGHFIWAKAFKVHIYEFSIGMGPVVHTHKGRDGINYNIRAFPIGGFVSMAGEVYDDDDKIDKKKLMCNKPWFQRLIILVAGVVNNFILAILILFFMGLFLGSTTTKPIVGTVLENSAVAESGIEVGDQILAINDIKANSWDKLQIALYRKNESGTYTFKIKKANGEEKTVSVTPKKVTKDDNIEENTIISQSVKEGERLQKTNGVIELVYATLITVYPDFTDGTYTKDLIQQFCDDNKITCTFKEEVDNNFNEGDIILQSRSVGDEVRSGTTLTITIATNSKEESPNTDDEVEE